MFIMRLANVAVAVQLASASVPLDLPLNQWPMIEAHDSASGYLEGNRILHPINTWTITQPSDVTAAVTTQLNCGARAFDWRPQVSSKDGSLVMHHGAVEIGHAMADGVQEMLDWAAEHTDDEDFLLLDVSDCSGDSCEDLAKQALTDLGLPKLITDCSELVGMTMGQALELSKLPGGGHLLPVFGCLDMNYRPEVACSGYTSSKAVGTAVEMYNNGPIPALDATQGSYTCYGGNKDFPINRMFSYLDDVSQAGPPSSGHVWSMQALWQETADSVVIGDLHYSSLLLDESKSGLNSLVTEAVAANRFPHINLLEVNNVCDGGPELLSALRAISREAIV